MCKTSEPVVDTCIRATLGPRGRLADGRDGAGALLALARQAPDLALRTERLSREIDLMAEYGLRLDPTTARMIGREEARATLWGRLALWAIALTLIWIAWQIA
jgi:ubiquinone biosynthesis protein